MGRVKSNSNMADLCELDLRSDERLLHSSIACTLHMPQRTCLDSAFLFQNALRYVEPNEASKR